MGQISHGCARTTEAVRRLFQRHGISKLHENEEKKPKKKFKPD